MPQSNISRFFLLRSPALSVFANELAAIFVIRSIRDISIYSRPAVIVNRLEVAGEIFPRNHAHDGILQISNIIPPAIFFKLDS